MMAFMSSVESVGEAANWALVLFVAEPFDAAVLHLHVRVEALGDGVGDDGLSLLLEQRDQPLLLRNQPIDLRRLAVEEKIDCFQLIGRWNRDTNITDCISI
jgi:hypothetical protein